MSHLVLFFPLFLLLCLGSELQTCWRWNLCIYFMRHLTNLWEGCKYQIINIVAKTDLVIHKAVLNDLSLAYWDDCLVVSQKTTGARSAHGKLNMQVRALIELKGVSKSLIQCYLLLLDQDPRLQHDKPNLPCQSPFQNTWHSTNPIIYCQSLSRAVKTGGRDKKKKKSI